MGNILVDLTLVVLFVLLVLQPKKLTPKPVEDEVSTLIAAFNETPYKRRFPTFPERLRAVVREQNLSGEELKDFLKPYEEVIYSKKEEQETQAKQLEQETLELMFQMRIGHGTVFQRISEEKR